LIILIILGKWYITASLSLIPSPCIGLGRFFQNRDLGSELMLPFSTASSSDLLLGNTSNCSINLIFVCQDDVPLSLNSWT
jgi:hypothetical protein